MSEDWNDIPGPDFWAVVGLLGIAFLVLLNEFFDWIG